MGSYNPCENDTKSLNVGLVQCLVIHYILKNNCILPNFDMKAVEESQYIRKQT